MPRVVSIFLPTLATDRIRRADPAISAETPIAVVARSGSKRTVVAVDAAAAKAGMRVGMPAAKAQAMITDLLMVDADPHGDADAIERLALWLLRQYSPIVATDQPDGLIMDSDGADHLRGGERMMLTELINTFRARGLQARGAIADTWGASHALSRSIRRETVIVPSGQTPKAVANLSIARLRLPADIVSGLTVLGFRTIGELSATPRAPLALRFGPEVGRRLDQMFGRLAEPIQPIRTAELIEVVRSFPEPIAAAETIARYVSKLAGQLCEHLETGGLGVRRADLVIYRVDNTLQSIRVGMAKPARNATQLTKLLCASIEAIDPGFGIEKLALAATFVEPLEAKQVASSLVEDTVVDVTPLLDSLGNRGQRLYRLAPVESDVPERNVQRISPVAQKTGSAWPTRWPRPSRMLDRPEPIEVIALTPDHPPASITWRGKRRRIRRGDGPERVFGEWWVRDAEMEAVRDYYSVEDDEGNRFWVYRSGDGIDPATGTARWFLHGIYG
ncbi:DNA polymerase Y family protein [Rhizobium pusense]|uniref:Y-family DNA polymerase n=1 Tax=Agrobacterium pusense TaxID=648995 RepID=UPI00244B60C9|nr:DNA polymerase Y family protein [Agrobacterium pusense]MDH1098671.1 DNA polymerase Y family protein [Agrobacterium pusense]MDH1115349.1 DNA polymerase Y family protein [Agrobacterium pusense]MDH2197233.1 DNA polymerase Y family protein [Agrobacterium pusense]